MTSRMVIFEMLNFRPRVGQNCLSVLRTGLLCHSRTLNSCSRHGGGTCLLYLLIVFSLIVSGNCKYSSDECDWRGAGLTEESSLRTVKQLYLQCSRGRIEWRYPSGAIRITLQYSPKGTEFRACIKPSLRSQGANIYTDVPQQLQLLIADKSTSLDSSMTLNSNQEKNSQETHCFHSINGKAAIFIEATPNMLASKMVTELEYSLEPIVPELEQDPLSDCRPCNDSELIRAFCSSDFVIKSQMREVAHDTFSKESFIDLAVSHVFRQRDEVFRPAKHSRYSGIVVTPLKCGVRQGDGHFLMTGSIVLGKARLGCAPRFPQFRRIAKAMTEKGLNDCDLSAVILG
ncbi:meteorin-like protein [Anneissia japonica]|uniref:meteorin-like protein n=1 Tax=Anneissia japonica TaxID=1529436 RepID=UPI001425A543|nr:meteorin-like protein [Anneissia japonica]